MKNFRIYILTLLLSLLTIAAAPDFISAQTAADSLNKAYELMNAGNIEAANAIFEKYVAAHPQDMKIFMQLAYNYKNLGNDDIAYKYFAHVAKYSLDASEVKTANAEISYLFINNRPFVVDAYSHNMYDSYQDNFITNTIIRGGKVLFENFTAGLYFDTYADSKSKPGLIYNDRYLETGSFFRYYFGGGAGFELRLGFVREIDFNENKFNFKPIVFYGERFGTYEIYKGSKPHLFAEIYSAALYDHKFENFYAQVNVKESVAFPFSREVAGEVYLRQYINGDSKRFDYNNYGEIAAGLALNFKNSYLPILFFETTNKFYFLGSPENSFQFKTGLLFNIYKAI